MSDFEMVYMAQKFANALKKQGLLEESRSVLLALRKTGVWERLSEKQMEYLTTKKYEQSVT